MFRTLSCIYILFCSVEIAWQIRKRNRIESFQQDTTRQRYQLPLAFWSCASQPCIIFLMIFSTEGIRLLSASILLGYALHICLCYAILLLLLPLLRKFISARACGYLWMIPPLGFPLANLGFSTKEPLLLIHTPVHLTNALIIIWAVGVVGILLWYLISHLYFRRQLLRSAKPVEDPKILTLWEEVLDVSLFKEPRPKLLRSPNTATPLSIGRKAKNMCVILPQKDYTHEDLRLIFYHELIHTGRMDVATKLCFSLLAAVFWFNPLMWIALRRIT